MSSTGDTFETTLRTLKGWIDASSGTPIQVRDDTTLAFRSEGNVTEIARERVAGVDPDYSTLMSRVGSCLLFYGGEDERGGVELYDPSRVPELYSGFFGGDGMDGFYPVGLNRDTLEIYAYDTTRSELPFSPFWHDSNPDDWRDTADELGTWTTLSEYLGRLVSDLGMTVI